MSSSSHPFLNPVFESLSYQASAAYLEINDQPQQQVRFRYASETRNEGHGYLYAISDSSNRKRWVSVQLKNWDVHHEAIVRCSLVTPEYLKHLNLLRRKCGDNFVTNSYQDILISNENDWIAEFSYMSIQQERFNNNDVEHKRMWSRWRDVAVLKFEAYALGKSIAEPVYSHQINNSKVCELKIVEVSKNEGLCTGGEKILIFIKKISKKGNIGIRFFETWLPQGHIGWSDEARFSPADVHGGLGISFRTPPYYHLIDEKVVVQFQLYLKNGDIVSDPQYFTYTPVSQGGADQAGLGWQQQLTSSSLPQQFPVFNNQQDSAMHMNIPAAFNNSPGAHLSTAGDSNLSAEEINVLFSFGNEVSNTNITSYQDKILNDLMEYIGDQVQSDASEPARSELQNQSKPNPNLLERQQTPEGTDSNGENALHHAVWNNNLDMVRNLLIEASGRGDKGFEFINTGNRIGWTPLHISVLEKRTELTILLLEFRADFQKTDVNKNTPLHLAAGDGQSIDCLRLLIEKIQQMSLDINPRNLRDLTPFHLAVTVNNTEGARLLMKSGADIICREKHRGKTALHTAVDASAVDILSFLLEKKSVDVNTQQGDGKTVLELAKEIGSYLVCEKLNIWNDTENESSSNESSDDEEREDRVPIFL